jgi:hypothetical protein
VIRPLGVGWERLDQKARMPRALALFWPLLPAGLFMVGMLLLGQLGLALALTLIWLLLTLPFSAHPRLLRRIEIRDGVLTYRRWLGPRLRVRLADLDRALICQISPFMAYGNYWVPVGAMGGGAPHLYLLDRKGRLRLRLLLVRYRPEHLEQLLAAIPVKVIREGPLTSSQFDQRYRGVLRRYRLQNQSPSRLVLSCCLGVPALVALLILLGILISDLISSLVQHHP